MNEKFIDKFFKTYSMISQKYANAVELDKILISTYYIDVKTKLLYPYQYIDFNLLYFINTKKYTNEYAEIVKFIGNYGFVDNYMSMLHLYDIREKIRNNNMDMVSEKEFLTLNKLYKNLI